MVDDKDDEDEVETVEVALDKDVVISGSPPTTWSTGAVQRKRTIGSTKTTWRIEEDIPK